MNQPLSTLNLPKDSLTKLKKLSYNSFEDLPDQIQVAHRAPATRTCAELLTEDTGSVIRENIINPDLTALLTEELVPGQIVEFVGAPGSGKTQICFHLASSVAGDSVFFIGTKNLACHRLREVASNSNSCRLDKIYCIETTTVAEFLAALNLFELWLKEHKDAKLLIIDSISWIVRQLKVEERTCMVQSLFQGLRKLAEVHKFAVVVTNDLTTRVSAEGSFCMASFGDSFFHAVNTRVWLDKSGVNKFSARVMKSSLKGQEQAYFFL